MLCLVPPVLDHVLGNVLRILLPQHRQPEHELHAQQVRIPAPPPAAACHLRTRRRAWVATWLVFWRVAVVNCFATDGARDLAVQPPGDAQEQVNVRSRREEVMSRLIHEVRGPSVTHH